MVLGRLRVTLKSNHMVTDADLSSSPVSGGGIRTPAVTPADTDEPFVVPLNVPSRFIAQYDASIGCLCRSDSSEPCFTSPLFLYLYTLPVSAVQRQLARQSSG